MSPPAILRPAFESAVTLQDRTPSRLFTDLYHHRQEIFSPLVERAQKAIDRPMPVRKRTRPVDQRISRSRLSESGEDGVLLYKNLQTTPATSTAAEEGMKPSEEVETAHRRVSIPERDTLPTVGGAEESTDDHENVSPTDDVLEDYTDPRPDDDYTPAGERTPSPPSPSRGQAAESEPADASTNDEPERPSTPPAIQRHSMDEDAPVTPIAGTTGARLSRARPISVHRDKLEDSVLAETGESSLKRAGSGEARAVRGPRGKSRSTRLPTHTWTYMCSRSVQAHAVRGRVRGSSGLLI